MYMITDTTNKVIALGARTVAPGEGQVRVALLDAQFAARDYAIAARDAAGADYLAAVQTRTSATVTDDLTAVDKAATAALRALTGSQIAAQQAEEAMASAEAATFAAFDAAQQAATKEFGANGEVWWDGKAFQARQAAHDPVATQRATDLATLAAQAQHDPVFAALLRVLQIG